MLEMPDLKSAFIPIPPINSFINWLDFDKAIIVPNKQQFIKIRIGIFFHYCKRDN